MTSELAPARLSHFSQRAARTLIPALCLLFLNLTLPSLISAQNVSPAEEDEVIRVRTDLVTLPFTVTDNKGARVADLRQADFQVLDAGRSVTISYFANAAARVALLFAVDTSGSSRDTIARQRDAALALLQRFGEGSRVGLLTFSEQSALALPLTTELGPARAAFSFTARPNSRTAIFDAALQAVWAFTAAETKLPERRIVVLLSDGLDSASRARVPEVIAAARRANVSFYVIHLPLYTVRDGELAARRPTKGFRELAAKTGGRYFAIGDASDALKPEVTVDLGPVFRAIADDLHSQYVIGYYLAGPARETGPRPVEIKLTSRAGRRLHVHNLKE
ncbi:MAG: VWA domain-containing protein [Pyrinomonadaceae bacterium]